MQETKTEKFNREDIMKFWPPWMQKYAREIFNKNTNKSHMSLHNKTGQEGGQ